MKNIRKTINLINERGISLIEVAASIVIIGVIFIALSGLLLQAKKSTVSSETIVDSTYIAQQYMEEIYNLTREKNLQDLKLYYSGRGTLHKTPTSSDPELIVELPHTQPNIKIELHFQPLAHAQTQLPSSSATKLFNIVTTVYENEQLKSTMENVIEIAL